MTDVTSFVIAGLKEKPEEGIGISIETDHSKMRFRMDRPMAIDFAISLLEKLDVSTPDELVDMFLETL